MSNQPLDPPANTQLIGYAYLIDHYRLHCPRPRKLSAITPTGRRRIQVRQGIEWLLLPAAANRRIPELPIAHLQIALKHEALDLCVLSRLFQVASPEELTAFIKANPAGIYTRKAWFLYEWMTGQVLPIPDLAIGNYVPLLDPAKYWTAKPISSPRHRIEDNLLGVPGFCPVVRRTDHNNPDRTQRLKEQAHASAKNVDPALLRRAVSYLLLNESRGSFAIEGETPPRTRLERWGQLIADAATLPLSTESIIELHERLFEPGQALVSYGLRQEGGFVGRHDRGIRPVPDHISARHEDLPSLMEGLVGMYRRLLGGDGLIRENEADPIVIATLIGFGFVFIHPFEDGNGRLHRFLIQKALADTRFNPPGVILPVSAAILEDIPGYRAALEDFSTSLLPWIEWEPTENGNVNVLSQTHDYYRYFDATRQVDYLVDRLERTIRFSLPQELQYLERFDLAKQRLAAKVDLPDRLMSLFIQFVVQNQGTLSSRKREDYFNGLSDEKVAELEAIVVGTGLLEVAPVHFDSE